MTTQELRELITTRNAINERRSRRVDRAVNFVFALLLGIIGAAALVRWLTPCAEGVLC